jgi:hypothetical protein
MIPDHSFECNSPDVVFENFGDEVILLNLQSGRYYSLDPLGMLYWEYLSQGVPPREVAAHICESYSGRADQAQVHQELEALFHEFQSEELIRPSNISRSLADVTNVTTQLADVYASPALMKFDDIAGMLALDPVHDVTEVGWPHPLPADPSKEDPKQVRGQAPE